jgi:hypothetical protein
MGADYSETWQSEVWGVVLDDAGSIDYYDTLAEALEWAGDHSEVVHIVTYKVAPSGD